jgi:hypothetical protein
MFGKRLGIGTGLATILAVSVVAIGASVADSSEPPAWQKGLHARSAGLNQKYGLPNSRSASLASAGVSSVPQPDWRRALEIRSKAMNARYGLGNANVTISTLTGKAAR